MNDFPQMLGHNVVSMFCRVAFRSADIVMDSNADKVIYDFAMKYNGGWRLLEDTIIDWLSGLPLDPGTGKLI